MPSVKSYRPPSPYNLVSMLAAPAAAVPEPAAITQSIFEKIGSPAHFKPVGEIPEPEFDQAWQQVSDYLESYQIRLGVCSPYIDSRELYRFAVEEFFVLPIETGDRPGVHYLYYYDNFYPDPFYENAQLALCSCIPDLLKKEPLHDCAYLSRGSLQLNQHRGLTAQDYVTRANGFKDYFEQIVLREIEDTGCRVSEQESVVSGRYEIAGICGREVLTLRGNWRVKLEPDAERYFWYVNGVSVEGLPF